VTATLDLDFTIATTLDPRITFSRASLATYYDSAGVLKYAAHNWAWPSEDFSNAQWTKNNGATVTVDAIAAPTGPTTADKLNHVTAGTVAGGNVSFGGHPIPPGVGIFSVYVKAGTKSWVSLGTATGTASQAWFNLSTGTVGTKGSSLLASGIVNAGGGWYRCWISRGDGFWTAGYIRVCEADNNINCTSPGDIYIWGAQTEFVTTATTPSTYIPTTSAAVHGPRFDYDPVTHAAKGLLIEEARTNVVLQNRDLTNAAWTKTSCTAAKTQTGIDGVVNSASSLTATGANATCLQAITLGSSARYQSAYVKRLTGSGVVNMTMNGGTTWTPVTVTANWTRVEIPTATLANPSVGFQIVTSGDAIAVDYVQNENGVVATSAMPTTSSTVTRAADVAVMTGSNFSDWYNQSQGTLVAEFDLLDASGTRPVISADGGSTAEQIMLYGSGTDPKALVRDGAVIQADIDVGTIAARTAYKLGLSYALNDVAASLNGGAVGTDVTATMPTPTQLRLGSDGTNYLSGRIAHLQFQNTALDDAALQTLTTPGPWSGGEPVPPAVGPTTTGGSAFWDQDYDDRESETSRKRRKRFLDERARRVAELE
jgi:hypothetical protein